MPMALQPPLDEARTPDLTSHLDPAEAWHVISCGQTVISEPAIRPDESAEWLAKEGLEVLRTSCHPQHLRLICGLLPPAISIRELSNRWKVDVGSLLAVDRASKHYANAIRTLPAQFPAAEADELLKILKCRRQPSIPRCQWEFMEELGSGKDALTIAETIDYCISHDFAQIPFSSWVRYVLGYETLDVSLLLRTAWRVRSDVQRYYRIRESRNEVKRELIELALLYRHPLAFWVIATSQHDEFPPADSALDFLLDPIRLLFTQADLAPLQVFDRLAYMGAKYYLRADNEVDPDWQSPISFSFWEHIQQPGMLARSITEHTQKLFRVCSPEDFLSEDSDRRKEIGVRWSELCDDVRACIVTEPSSLPYVVRLAERFIQQRDYSSAAAVGSALYHAFNHIRGVLSELPIWSDISPENDFAGCRRLFESSPGLPYLPPLIHKLQTSDNCGSVLSELFQYVRVFGTERGSSSFATYGKRDATPVSGKEVVLRHNLLMEEKACEKDAILDRNPSVNGTNVLSFSTCKRGLDANETSKGSGKVAGPSPLGSAIEESLISGRVNLALANKESDGRAPFAPDMLETIQNRHASWTLTIYESTNDDRCGRHGDCAIDDDLWTDEEDSEKDEDGDTFRRIEPLSILPPHQSLLSQTLHTHKSGKAQDALPLSEAATQKNMMADLCHDIFNAQETVKLARSCERCIGYRKGTPIAFHHHETDRRNIFTSERYEGTSDYYADGW